MILDQFRLDGKAALVTGCRRGIGAAMAIALAEAGADIIGVSANLELTGSETGESRCRAGPKLSSVPVRFREAGIGGEFHRAR